jgi:hypothetical protein
MLKQDPIPSFINGDLVQRCSIVNFRSTQGVVGILLFIAYAVSKHAVIDLVRAASENYAAQAESRRHLFGIHRDAYCDKKPSQEGNGRACTNSSADAEDGNSEGDYG